MPQVELVRRLVGAETNYVDFVTLSGGDVYGKELYGVKITKHPTHSRGGSIVGTISPALRESIWYLQARADSESESSSTGSAPTPLEIVGHSCKPIVVLAEVLPEDLSRCFTAMVVEHAQAAAPSLPPPSGPDLPVVLRDVQFILALPSMQPLSDAESAGDAMEWARALFASSAQPPTTGSHGETPSRTTGGSLQVATGSEPAGLGDVLVHPRVCRRATTSSGACPSCTLWDVPTPVLPSLQG
jgi:hypothetical protein